MKTKVTLLVILLLSLIGYSQSIEKYSIDSGGTSVTTGGIEVLYTIGEVAIAERSTLGIVVSEGFINSSFRVSVDPKVFLQGAMLNPATVGLMNDDLRVNNYLPLTSPYGDGAVVNVSVFNDGGTLGNGVEADDIVDWVWLELRDANDNTIVRNGRSALLQRDGDIVALDGISNINMNVAPANYYLVIKHRNHAGIMTANTINVSESSTTTVNFKDSSHQITFGTNAQTSIGMPAGILGMWAGNADGNDELSFANDGNSILFDVLFHLNNTSSSSLYTGTNGYFNGDMDLNGNVSFQDDLNNLLFNILFHPDNTSLSSLFNFSQQLPN